jgi:hypothetical protein
MLGSRELLGRFVGVQLVQPLGEPLCGAAVVYEDDGRGVFSYELEKLGVDRWPDRADVS